ncbi:MAG: hypothetical protein ACRDHY_06150 [Anaerolineales bacterium]
MARKRLDLFLTIRRRFLEDRTVHVLLDRREHARRGRQSPVEFPERRRQQDRRRPRDYWEDIDHHPAVLIPLPPRQVGPGMIDPLPSDEVPQPDKEPAMESVATDEARVRAWFEETQHVVQHVLPSLLDERETLRSRLQEVTRRCRDLQEENDGLRADVTQFLEQVTNVLGPMRALAEQLGHAGQLRD